MSYRPLLDRTTDHAVNFLQSLESRPVSPSATTAELRAALGKALPESGMAPEQVVDELVRDVAGGLLASSSGRFFGWVIGGTHPAALAADWLTSAWDQNAAAYACSPAGSIVEEVCGGWLKQLLGLPASASYALVTGCQAAHTTALAAARHKLLADRGWDVEARGLAAAPAIRILASELRHETLVRAVRLLGIGESAIAVVASDDDGRIKPEALEAAIKAEPEAPTIVCLQAGDLDTGIFDPFAGACEVAQAAGAWVHVDGAFGLWVATSDRYRHLLAGVEGADSWATDGHKWLNLPYDIGFAFVAHPAAHKAAMSQDSSYRIVVEETRDQADWNPEWSRRGRAFPTYAAIRSLGREGIGALVERCCDHAQRLVREIGTLPGAEVLAAPRINQGLVRFRAADGDHDARTDAVIEKIQASGDAWFGGTLWRGLRVMRVSVCNWQTSDRDVDAAIEAVHQALKA